MTDYDKLFEELKTAKKTAKNSTQRNRKSTIITNYIRTRKPKRAMYKSYKWDIWKVMSKIPPGFTGAGGETKDAVIRKVGGSRSDVNNSITQMIDEKTLVYNNGKLSINPEIFGLLFEKRLEFLLFYTYIERDDDVSQIDMDSLTRDVEIYNERN